MDGVTYSWRMGQAEIDEFGRGLFVSGCLGPVLAADAVIDGKGKEKGPGVAAYAGADLTLERCLVRNWSVGLRAAKRPDSEEVSAPVTVLARDCAFLDCGTVVEADGEVEVVLERCWFHGFGLRPPVRAGRFSKVYLRDCVFTRGGFGLLEALMSPCWRLAAFFEPVGRGRNRYLHPVEGGSVRDAFCLYPEDGKAEESLEAARKIVEKLPGGASDILKKIMG